MSIIKQNALGGEWMFQEEVSQDLGSISIHRGIAGLGNNFAVNKKTGKLVIFERKGASFVRLPISVHELSENEVAMKINTSHDYISMKDPSYDPDVLVTNFWAYFKKDTGEEVLHGENEVRLMEPFSIFW